LPTVVVVVVVVVVVEVEVVEVLVVVEASTAVEVLPEAEEGFEFWVESIVAGFVAFDDDCC